MKIQKLKHKFQAKPTFCDGIRFDSKKEAKYYAELCLRRKNGEVLFFLRQVPFHLPGKTKYVCDFLVFYDNGEAEFIDTKGFMTPQSKTKIAQVEELYGVKVRIV